MQEFTTPGAVDVAERQRHHCTAGQRGALPGTGGSVVPGRGPVRRRVHRSARHDRAGAGGRAHQPRHRAGLTGLPVHAGAIEFTYLDYAIWAAGCATVTIYETSSADQVEWIVGNSGAVAVICGSDQQREVFDSVADKLPRGEARVHGGRRGRGRAHQAGPPDRPERGGRADRRHQARGPRHARLHVRHDRAAEGPRSPTAT